MENAGRRRKMFPTAGGFSGRFCGEFDETSVTNGERIMVYMMGGVIWDEQLNDKSWNVISNGGLALAYY